MNEDHPCTRVPPPCPDEVWLQIFSFLEPMDLGNAAQTCRHWAYLIECSETLWKSQCLSISDPQLKEEVLHEKTQEKKRWMDVFKDNYGHQLTRRQWLSGKFSHFTSVDDIPTKVFCPLSAETWGEIFEQELSR